MKNEEQIREEIRAVLNRILDEEYESALKMLEEGRLWKSQPELKEDTVEKRNKQNE